MEALSVWTVNGVWAENLVKGSFVDRDPYAGQERAVVLGGKATRRAEDGKLEPSVFGLL